MVDTPEHYAAIQQDLDRLRSWVERNLLKYNKSRHLVRHPGRNNPKYHYRSGPDLGRKAALQRRNCEFLWMISWLWASSMLLLPRGPILFWGQEDCGQQVKRGDPVPLLCPRGLHLDYWIQFWSPQLKKAKEPLEQVDEGSAAPLLHLEKAERWSHQYT